MAELDLELVTQVAIRAADAARPQILSRFGCVAAEQKADGSLVTEADRVAELTIRGVLERETPEIGLFGEEFGGDPDREGPCWWIDPIDGTISFARGIPLFGTLIALVENGEPLVGLIDLPALDERVVGYRGGGVRCNGKVVRASRETSLKNALVSHGDPYCFEMFEEIEAFKKMSLAIPKFRGYPDAFGHALTICGRVDAMVDLALKPWDVAATRLLIEESGGRCVLLDRSEKMDYGLGLVFGNSVLVEQLANYLHK